MGLGVPSSLKMITGVIWTCLLGSALAADGPAQSVVFLSNGSFLPGELRESDDVKLLRWRSPVFARPLEFPLSVVKAVHYPAPALAPKAAGDFCFELVDDDMLYGDLVSLTDDEVELTSPLGRLHLRREHVRRIYRPKNADSIYLGPNGLAGWNDPAAMQLWRDEGGQVFTDRPRATLFGDFAIPERAVIEIEISWKTKPDFVLAFGVNDRDESIKRAFRFEVWDGELVVVGESARDADVAIVQSAAAAGGQARIQFYLDQNERRLILLSRSGRPLATLKIADSKPSVHSGVRLTNNKGDVRLEYLRIGRWNGVAPRDVRDDQARLQKTDGSIVYGQLARFDPVSKQFVVREGGTETVIPHDAITDLFLAPSRSGKDSTDSTAPRTLRALYRDGSRFSGQVTRIENEYLTMICAGVKEPLRLPLAGARSLIVLRHGEVVDQPVAAGRPGRLEMDGLSLTGRLVGESGQPDASPLVWHADLSRNSSSLRLGLSGRIVYRDPTPVLPKVRRVEPEPAAPGFAGMVRNVWSSKPAPVPTSGRPSMHLRTGDTIPCEVSRIDEKGVTFKAPQTDATFVPNDKIKSVELIANRDAPGLDETKRDRLLTLPRMQKDSPPTHLICSKNGDFLRGRIIEMDDARVIVEVRLETKEIPRDRIAQIIWLHADELKAAKGAVAPADVPRVTRVQTINTAGNRLTFVLEKSDEQSVSGTSEVLGACRANLADLDQLLFGSFIEQSAAQLAYHVWKLHHATEPKFVQSEGAASADGAATGLESPLVGQPAPTFQLDLLDGAKFKLAEHKGRVVILDFWATWCGPCLQYMPQVDEVAREFADRGVELVAVNMEEQPEQVKSMLERHNLKMAVVLDRDGATAAKYAVSAIPQTVVIDREGKVARLFVGGGKSTADALRKSLQELTAK